MSIVDSVDALEQHVIQRRWFSGLGTNCELRRVARVVIAHTTVGAAPEDGLTLFADEPAMSRRLCARSQLVESRLTSGWLSMGFDDLGSSRRDSEVEVTLDLAHKTVIDYGVCGPRCGLRASRSAAHAFADINLEGDVAISAPGLLCDVSALD